MAHTDDTRAGMNIPSRGRGFHDHHGRRDLAENYEVLVIVCCGSVSGRLPRVMLRVRFL